MPHAYLTLLLSMAALLPAAAAPAVNRPAFGVVAAEMTPELRAHARIPQGILVQAVWPGSPADKAGVQPGAVILSLNGTPVEDKAAMAAFLAQHRAGDVVSAELIQLNGEKAQVQVQLVQRPAKAAQQMPTAPDRAVGGDRVMRPLTIRSEIREGIRARRAIIIEQLHALPDGMDAMKVTDALNDIRNLARDANPYGGEGWMVGRAGESSVQFKDAEGVLLLIGADNALRLEVFDVNGCKVLLAPVTTPEQCRALPETVLQRLKDL